MPMNMAMRALDLNVSSAFQGAGVIVTVGIHVQVDINALATVSRASLGCARNAIDRFYNDPEERISVSR
jgi:hypothetical protein